MDAGGIAACRTIESILARQAVRLVHLARAGRTGHTSYSACLGIVDLVKHVDHMDPTPLYVQLASILRDMIDAGELQPGAALPSESYLQGEHGVARGTVRMAVGILREEGRVITLAGRGTFVRAPDPG